MSQTSIGSYPSWYKDLRCYCKPSRTNFYIPFPYFTWQLTLICSKWRTYSSQPRIYIYSYSIWWVFFFKYRRRVYQIWKGMLIDYSPTYSVVVTVTMQRNNAIVIWILRRDGSRATSCYCDRILRKDSSRATSTLTSWKISFKLCKLLFL